MSNQDSCVRVFIPTSESAKYGEQRDQSGYVISSWQSPRDRTSLYLGHNKPWIGPKQANVVTHFQYDKVGRLTHTIFADNTPGDLTDNPYTETVYDDAGRPQFEFDERGNITEIVYDPDCGCANRRERIIQHRASLPNLVTSFQYDDAGNQRFVTDPRGNTTEFQYDQFNRLTHTVLPATDEHPATTVETVYDKLGRRVAQIDQEGKRTDYGYDALGRLVSVTQPPVPDFNNGGVLIRPVTRYGYDEVGNLITQTDAEGRVTTFWHDEVGRRTKRVLPAVAGETQPVEEVYAYDAFGNLDLLTDFNGYTTDYLFDTMDRLRSKAADPTHPSLAFGARAKVEMTYKPNGLRETQTITNASQTVLYAETYSYDARNRLTLRETSFGDVDYDYDAASNLSLMRTDTPDGVHLTYDYDEINRLEYVWDESATRGSADGSGAGAAAQVAVGTYTYNANGAVEHVAYANGVSHTYTYDTLNRVRFIDIGGQLGSQLFDFEYTLRRSGHRAAIEDRVSGRTRSYEYDNHYRLTKETITGAAFLGGDGVIAYQYDTVGNRRVRTSSVLDIISRNSTVNARDLLDRDTYDLNGNTLADSTGGFTDTYDFEDRLVRRENTNTGEVLTFLYDADGIRVQKETLASGGSLVESRRFLTDSLNHTGYAQVIEEHVTTSDLSAHALERKYAFGLDLLNQSQSPALTNTANWTTVAYLYDALGTVIGLTDASGSLTDRYTYDAFGNTLLASGSTANAYRYTGEQFDADLGLYYLRARYLSPNDGRFERSAQG